MKQTLFLLLITFVIGNRSCAQVQADPAHWAYGIKKLNANLYEVHLRCTIDAAWHIYAQKQGKDFIGTATKVVFNKQTGLTLVGTLIESGKKDKWEAKEVGITNYEYAGVVDFVQKVKLATDIKQVSGTITYQTCTHKQCLAEQTISFTIPVP